MPLPFQLLLLIYLSLQLFSLIVSPFSSSLAVWRIGLFVVGVGRPAFDYCMALNHTVNPPPPPLVEGLQRETHSFSQDLLTSAQKGNRPPLRD